jgi:vacuolar-type H+-ATPase catalytic subunit A/Vma1
MNTNPNDSAFPVDSGEMGMTEGLTKREYFAAMAMQGILSSSADRGTSAVAKNAVEFADALMEKLNQPKQ